MTRTYDPKGKAHRILSRLTEGPAMMETFWSDAGVAHKPNARRKLFYVVVTLKSSGFISLAGAGFAITPSGLRAHAQLQAGQQVVVGDVTPGARTFRRSAA